MLFRYILAVFICLPVHAAEFPPVEELMTDEELQRTGLHKLDETERQAFRRWLEAFVEHDAEFVERRYRENLRQKRSNSEDKPTESVAEQEQERERSHQEDGAITSNIDGEFSGWDGRPRFELANGQVWEHRRKHSIFSHRPIDSPEVIIKKNFLGFYMMEIPEANVKVPVRRIE